MERHPYPTTDDKSTAETSWLKWGLDGTDWSTCGQRINAFLNVISNRYWSTVSPSCLRLSLSLFLREFVHWPNNQYNMILTVTLKESVNWGSCDRIRQFGSWSNQVVLCKQSRNQLSCGGWGHHVRRSWVGNRTLHWQTNSFSWSCYDERVLRGGDALVGMTFAKTQKCCT